VIHPPGAGHHFFLDALLSYELVLVGQASAVDRSTAADQGTWLQFPYGDH
jgi:hypothetical protein